MEFYEKQAALMGATTSAAPAQRLFRIATMIIEQNSPREQPFAAHDVVRSDLNLEKWTIWRPTHSQNSPEVRIIEREIVLPNGSKGVARVEIGFTNHGVLTTEDQRVVYALFGYWNEKGQPSGRVPFSVRRLMRFLKRPYSVKSRNSVIRSLLRLRATPFTWHKSYFDKCCGETVSELDTFNILSSLRLVRVEKDGGVNREAGLFQFNEHIVASLVNHYTKPVFLDTVVSFKSEIAQLLYTRLDLLLADKLRYERRSRELFFDDLALRGKDYNKVSARKRTLERALKELEGKPLTTGTLSEAKLEKTEDGKDYKAVFKKAVEKATRKRGTKNVDVSPEPIAALEPAREEPLSSAVPKDISKAHALLLYFDEKFFSAPQEKPSSNVLRKAEAFIDEHGFEKGIYLVNFAFTKSQESGYEPATFAGITRFMPKALEALAEEERIKRIQERDAVLAADRRERDRWDTLQKKHQEEYNTFINAEAAKHMEVLGLFEEEEKISIDTITQQVEDAPRTQRKIKEVLLRAHTKTEARYARLFEFFKAHDTPLPSFMEWYEGR